MHTMSSGLFVEVPSRLDVLCGQDANYGQHCGNKILRKQIDLAVSAYKQTSDRQEKMAKIDAIITFMRRHCKSRFLRPSRQGESASTVFEWEELSEQSIRDKVSHALRFAAKRQRQRQGHRNTLDLPKKRARTNKAKRTKAIKRANIPNDTSNSYDEMDDLDDRAKARLVLLHERQLEILEGMLEADDETIDEDGEEEEVYSTTRSEISSSTDSATSITTSATNGSARDLEDQFWQELRASVEPIPIAIPSSPASRSTSPCVEVRQPASQHEQVIDWQLQAEKQISSFFVVNGKKNST